MSKFIYCLTLVTQINQVLLIVVEAITYLEDFLVITASKLITFRNFIGNLASEIYIYSYICILYMYKLKN